MTARDEGEEGRLSETLDAHARLSWNVSELTGVHRLSRVPTRQGGRRSVRPRTASSLLPTNDTSRA